MVFFTRTLTLKIRRILEKTCILGFPRPIGKVHQVYRIYTVSGRSFETAGMSTHHPSSLRNREPIFNEIKPILAKHFKISDNQGDEKKQSEERVDKLKFLEVGSGTGAHVEYFAPRLPHFQFFPTEYLPSQLSSPSETKLSGEQQPLTNFNNALKSNDGILEVIDKHLKGFSNVESSVALDASQDFSLFPEKIKKNVFDVMYVSNVFHITPWPVTVGFFKAAKHLLKPEGLLFTYGPYKLNGEFTTESNKSFDESLRKRNSSRGYRDVSEVAAQAEINDVQFKQRIDMPANNFLLIFQKNR